MDKNLKSLVAMSALVVFLCILAAVFFGYIYRYSTIYTYTKMLLIAILLIILIMLAFILSMSALFYTYRTKRAGGFALILSRVGLKLLIPFTAVAGKLFKINKDALRDVFIAVNNISVCAEKKKYEKDQVLVLLPHCLQNSHCKYKITNDITNCRRCGGCCIGEILDVSKKTGVETTVVTGGTVARKLVSEKKPKLILSVACERDLVSGIKDVGKIPVIGILNIRPNGPCNNTTVDTNELKKNIEAVLKETERDLNS